MRGRPSGHKPFLERLATNEVEVAHPKQTVHDISNDVEGDAAHGEGKFLNATKAMVVYVLLTSARAPAPVDAHTKPKS
jgi:hypothetical protein